VPRKASIRRHGKHDSKHQRTNQNHRWTVGTLKIKIPEGKLQPAEAQRKGDFYLVYTQHGKKQEPKVKARPLRQQWRPHVRNNVIWKMPLMGSPALISS